jgi:hypothetical protein
MTAPVVFFDNGPVPTLCCFWLKDRRVEAAQTGVFQRLFIVGFVVFIEGTAAACGSSHITLLG